MSLYSMFSRLTGVVLLSMVLKNTTTQKTATGYIGQQSPLSRFIGLWCFSPQHLLIRHDGVSTYTNHGIEICS